VSFIPVGNASRNGSDGRGARLCPVCDSPVGSTRARFCSGRCRVAAFRLRRQQPRPVLRVAKHATVYECPSCGRRLLGEQRCDACNVFARRVGVGGPCPHCDEPVAVFDLVQEVLG